MTRHPLMLAVPLVLLLAGCHPEMQTSGQLLDRLDSAQLIAAPAARQSALAGIAQDAARSGEPDVCLRAVDDLQASPLRDKTAAACAQTFNARGERVTADALVGRIAAPAERERLRVEYANHAPPARTTYY